MIHCIVTEDRLGNLTVCFDGGRSLYLQSDYEKISFGTACGLIDTPDDWDGSPIGLEISLSDYDFGTISECPEDYWDVAGLQSS